MRHFSLRDRSRPTPELLDERENSPRTIDWVLAGILVTCGLIVFGVPIWAVFFSPTAIP